MHLMGKYGPFPSLFEPFGPGAFNPSVGDQQQRRALDQHRRSTVEGDQRSGVERASGLGYASYGIDQVESDHDWSKHWQAADGITTDGPRITFRGFSIPARNNNLPRYHNQNVYNFHDDFTLSYNAKGPPRSENRRRVCVFSGTTRATVTSAVARMHGKRRTHSGQHRGALFPDAFNADTWNLNANLEDHQ